MKRSSKKILLVFIESTPYISRLIEDGFSYLKNELDIVFLTKNLSQDWNLQPCLPNNQFVGSKKAIFYLLVNILFKRKYRLIHVAGWSHPFILSLILLSRFLCLPVVVESDTPFNTNTQIWKKIIKSISYPLLFKLPVFFLPGGTRQAQYLAYYGVAHDKMIQAQMTVDVTYIKNYIAKIDITEREQIRLQHQAKKNELVFLFVGRLLEWKGIHDLIAAVGLLYDLPVKLWIVGSGELSEEIQLIAKQSQQIVYFGRVSGDLLWRIYHAADVFVIPSHAEPWGLVVNEAMAAGLPIIATKEVGCIDDLVLENYHGMIVPAKNVIALSRAMRDMFAFPDKRKYMAKNASLHIADWTLKNEAQNIISAWEKSS